VAQKQRNRLNRPGTRGPSLALDVTKGQIASRFLLGRGRGAGTEMKIAQKIGLAIALALMCSACADRYIAFYYYPGVGSPESFERKAQKECEKYGMVAVRASWQGLEMPSPNRERETWRCETR
jgi:hypothetical protein